LGVKVTGQEIVEAAQDKDRALGVWQRSLVAQAFPLANEHSLMEGQIKKVKDKINSFGRRYKLFTNLYGSLMLNTSSQKEAQAKTLNVR